VLWGFAIEYYGGQVAIPPAVIVPAGFEDPDLLAMYLGERRGSAVDVRVAQRGEKRRLVELADGNAEMALEHDRLVAQRTRARRVEALEELREKLNLEGRPVRVEVACDGVRQAALALQHAAGHGMSVLLHDLKQSKEQGYMELQRKEWADGADIPTRSHHLFTGVPYHQHVGQQYGATRLSEDLDEHLEVSKVV